ncbi:MAG: HD domain-containing protein [Flavobacteriales bacterium]
MNHKIINDPVYGFITLPYGTILSLIEHPYFQRLRRIKQLGLSHLVYPGALHTRFHHAIGTMHLMSQAIEVIRSKGHDISEEEAEAAQAAILLHDIGHGPYSHALEESLVKGVDHEDLSALIMDNLNREFKGKLDLAIAIFKGEYKKNFLHQLVSSQLDMDRLDYLKRDSFYSGVSEGVVGSDRIIKMLNVKDDQLIAEQKGIYSLEKFIIARRLMYWQVYLHKTVLSAEQMLSLILKRAKKLALRGSKLFCSPQLKMFLYNDPTKKEFADNPKILDTFSKLDDFDIFGAIKVWCDHKDKILSSLCKKLVYRDLFKVEMQNDPFEFEYSQKIEERIKKEYNLNDESCGYFFIEDKTLNNAYDPRSENINILMKNGNLKDIAEASDNLNISALSRPVEKYFLCYPGGYNA